MKKLLVTTLVLAMSVFVLTACGSSDDTTTETTETADATESTDETEYDFWFLDYLIDDWSEYDALIDAIRTETDLEVREELMHEAENIIMATGAILPIYYYNDTYMVKDYVDGLYSSVYGHKFFKYVSTDTGVLNANLTSEPSYLDPALLSASDCGTMAKMLFSGLYTYAEDGSLVPEAATGYTLSDDSLVYTITLKEGMVWSDGSTFDATDFVYSWNRGAAEETASDYGYMFDVIATNDDGTLDVVASDDGLTLTVTLASPCAYFIDLLAFTTYLPVHQESIESYDGWETNPGQWVQEAGFVTCGPFYVESWVHDESIVFAKNELYHDADSVSLDTINFMLSDDDAVVYAAYVAGDLDFIDTVPNDLVSDLLGTDDFYVADQLGTYYACFNVDSDLFEGKTDAQAAAMRIAISYLIDRDYIVTAVAQAGQVVATTFIPPGIQDGQGGEFKLNDDDYTYPIDGEEGYVPADYSQENIDYAIALLEYAGYVFDEDGTLSDETPIYFEYLTNTSTAHTAVAEAMQQDLAVIGITMTISEQEWSVFLDERKEGNYDFARNGWISDFSDPINMLEMWISSSGNNTVQFGD